MNRHEALHFWAALDETLWTVSVLLDLFKGQHHGILSLECLTTVLARNRAFDASCISAAGGDKWILVAMTVTDTPRLSKFGAPP